MGQGITQKNYEINSAAKAARRPKGRKKEAK
jgi:hypothetical protein